MAMESKARAKFVRLSPKKARLVIDLVRGKPVGDALKALRFAKQKAATPILKTLESAIANAEHNFEMDVDSLVISDARIDEGPSLRRLNMRARGMADIVRRPTCHITVVVSERGGNGSES
jgi:large subunit ribosomal protein L22